MAVFGHLKQTMSNWYFPDNYPPLLALQRIVHVSISPYRPISKILRTRVRDKKSTKKLPILLVISMIFSNLEVPNNIVLIMITESKVTEIFLYYRWFLQIIWCWDGKNALGSTSEAPKRRRKRMMSDAEVITILICFHFNSFRNLKHYYLGCVRQHWRHLFPKTFSYNRFVEVMPRCFVALTMFLKLACFGKCCGISFVYSTCIPAVHNKRQLSMKVFKGIAEKGKSTMVCWIQAASAVQWERWDCQLRIDKGQCRWPQRECYWHADRQGVWEIVCG